VIETFEVLAEPSRRRILDLLREEERPVGDLVRLLAASQPSVSKHLRVLLDVGLVDVRRDGRQAFYRTNADGLRPVHAWAAMFERYWHDQLARVKTRAERN
jgi:DNA-binding transcriptional ArsR family regulator